MMGPDRMRERLEAGEVAYGVLIPWPNADLVEAAGVSGFDYVFIDAEHGALDRKVCVEMVRAASWAGMASLIRVPYSDIRGAYAYLDMGAHGLIFPHITSEADARSATRVCLFPPEGSRGASSSSRAARYGTKSKAEEYYRSSNKAVWVVPVIEDVEGVDALEEILAVPGIQTFFVGPGDLALSRLTSGNANPPPVDKLVDQAIATGVRLGKYVAAPAATPAIARTLVEKGVRVVVIGATALFTGACRAYLDAVPGPSAMAKP